MKKKFFAKNKVWWVVLGSLLVNVFLGLKIFGVFEGIGREAELGRGAVRVVDGDTFDTDKEERVRLKGAEAPEYPEE